MLGESLQTLFKRFFDEAAAYLEQPGVMKALELDQLCMKLYPLVARETGDMALSHSIRDFGRNLPRKEVADLRVLFEEIQELAADLEERPVE